jgi:hypothetical protein
MNIGDTFSVNHKGRTITGTVTEVIPPMKNFGATCIVLKSKRREYGVMVAPDGRAWVAC